MTPDDIEYIVIHCAYTPITMDIGAKEIKNWHTAHPRNWSDIGYHYVVRRDGAVEQGRKCSVPGAHAKGYNNKSLGICLVGGMGADGSGEDNFDESQFASLHAMLIVLLNIYPDAEILGHTDLPGVSKSCPCFNVKNWLLALNEQNT